MADKMMMVLVLATLAASATILILTLRVYFRTEARLESLEKEIDRMIESRREASQAQRVILGIKVPDSFQREAFRLHVCDGDDPLDFPNEREKGDRK